MNVSYLLLLLVLSTNAVSDSVFSNFKENLRSLLDTSGVESENLRRGLKTFLHKKGDGNLAQNENVQKTVRTHEKKLQRDMSASKMTTSKNIGRSYIHVDPVYDSLKNRRLWQKSKFKASFSASASSEIEMKFWMEDWEELRENETAKAFNASQLQARDVVNMKMARPSGVPCGDPNQHDLPWGVCLLPGECEAEYRIYRGDSNCGRSQYVCCTIVDTAYDMYEAPDLSFEHDNSLTTDSDLDNVDTREEKHRAILLQKHEKSKGKRLKTLLKKKIRNSIANVINEITKLVHKTYRNATSQRILKTQELMAFVKQMKKQYRKDRQALVDVHEFDLMKYDLALQGSLDNIHGVNVNFMKNETFRDIVINGTVNKEELKRLQKTHPVLSLFYKNRRMGGDLESEQTRTEEPEAEKERTGIEVENERSGIEEEEPGIDEDAPRTEEDGPETEEEEPKTEEDEPETKKKPPKRLDYDVEFGLLYY